MNQTVPKTPLTFDDFKTEVLHDYRTAVTSRECSLLGRREVLTGKAKFGIFGDGKEVPQLAMAKAFKNGDFRSGYYRDQTFMMAIGELTTQQFFAGLYGHPDLEHDPMSAGRQMGGHFTTHSLDENGRWKNLTQQKNSSCDISPTAAQMPRLVGLAQASKIYRNLPILSDKSDFSVNGNEVAWGTIGNASTSEGIFFEALNAAGVLQIPVVMSVWDDDYGISVHAKYQTTKENISEILKGFQRDDQAKGYEILTVKGWDYATLIAIYQNAAAIAREEHVPVLIHVQQLTQPQGHSTSGSHERYKSPERLAWEAEFDCIRQMRLWMIANHIATPDDLDSLEETVKKEVLEAKKTAWNAFLNPIKAEREALLQVLQSFAEKPVVAAAISGLKALKEPLRKDLMSVARQLLPALAPDGGHQKLSLWISTYRDAIQPLYSSHLHSVSADNALSVLAVPVIYDEAAPEADGRVVLRSNFDALLAKHPEVLIFGEDAGNIGDVNQGLEGMQQKYGELRVADAGIREATIIGQGIGMALRGLRPIAEIQYLDYLLYAIQILSDDLATLQYRTKGRQKAPLIIRTRGHRLEGIWHSGSPMSMILGALRGIYVLVPRNMTQAAGFYNTLLASDEPALVIECLNGYRLKEKMPANHGEYRTPIGLTETLREGNDLTVVSYGSTLRIIEEAANRLSGFGISCEIIDVQSLLPFDLKQDIVKSVAKTNRLIVVDEDVPGGASAYILQEVLEKQDAWKHLDSKPETLTAKPHRPAYGSDGDYFSKPSAEDVFEKIYDLMREANPAKFPALY